MADSGVVQEAWKAYGRLLTEVAMAGFPELVEEHYPPQDAGFLEVMECVSALREDFEAIQAKRR